MLLMAAVYLTFDLWDHAAAVNHLFFFSLLKSFPV